LATYQTLDDVNVKGKVVIVRVDFNSEINSATKKVASDVRIRAHAESTIKELSEKGAKVVILAHQGRKGDPDFTPLKEHAEILGKILCAQVQFVDDVYGEKAKSAIKNLKSGQILVLDNVRLFAQETKEGTPEQHSKTDLVQNLAPLADLFVNDAFAAAHRAHVSLVGFTAVLPSVAGRVMERELVSLSKALEKPEHPCVYVMGGGKADDALEISKYVLTHNIADYVLTGGVVAQIFLTAKGYDLGKPNRDLIAKKELTGFIPGIKILLKQYHDKIIVPIDLAVNIAEKRKEIRVDDLPTGYPIFDIGSKTAEIYGKYIASAKSVVASGPMGVYENKEFAIGTKKVFKSIADSCAFSLAGGGHTISALQGFGLSSKISYVSTAGGALAEFLMGKKLPGVAALENSVKKKIT
jgi:phosphoglycerate kinase